MASYILLAVFLGFTIAHGNNIGNICYECSYQSHGEVVYGLDYAGSAWAPEVCAGPLEFTEAEKEDLPVNIVECYGPCFVRYNNVTGELTRGCYERDFSQEVYLTGFKFDKCNRIWNFCMSDEEEPCNGDFYPSSYSGEATEEEMDRSEWCGEDFLE